MREGKSGKNRRALYLVTGSALLLVIFTFTPVILRPGKVEPRFLSMPYTLWTSILITIILVFLTYLATRFRDRE